MSQPANPDHSTVTAPDRSAPDRLLIVAVVVALTVSVALLHRNFQRAAERERLPQATSPAPPVHWLRATLQVPTSTLVWTVELAPVEGRVRSTQSGSWPGLDGHSAQLWWMSPQGPVSLGVLPYAGQQLRALPAGLPAGGDVTLTVTLEPLGGAPAGRPTGAVLVTAVARDS